MEKSNLWMSSLQSITPRRLQFEDPNILIEYIKNIESINLDAIIDTWLSVRYYMKYARHQLQCGDQACQCGLYSTDYEWMSREQIVDYDPVIIIGDIISCVSNARLPDEIYQLVYGWYLVVDKW